ncbi:Glycosyltransferase afumC (Fumihopaside A biosynthesis cluster protein C) [Durusdinium trenchii]|uniref:Glycosyltransferase afumC (Fumihopaside A biosynthesis cluster protein C) n=1 Tax=Durusdinium trenchii TaxID=1381693 RepID=A0ABP0JVB9_9DINO
MDDEEEGDEDWRYGPLGRAGVLKDAEPVPPEPAESKSEASQKPLRCGEVNPRTIWAYWAQGHEQMPEFFRLCVNTWQRTNPHWDVRILQKSTVLEYLLEEELPNRFFDMTSHQTASDAVRLGVLSRYGGVWLDVNILLCGSLDRLCWNAIRHGTPACVFFHPSYGTEALGGQDFVESWCLATKPENPFFMRWREIFKELFQDRLGIDGLLKHRLYKGLDLSGFEKLNRDFQGSGMESPDAGGLHLVRVAIEIDMRTTWGAGIATRRVGRFREYLAIHAMCHRLLETDPESRRAWRDDFLKVNAADTAFRLQMVAQASDMHMAQVLLLEDTRAEQLIEGVPLIKFRTPDYGPLLQLSTAQLTDRRHLLGRLLDPAPRAGARAVRAPQRVSMSFMGGARRFTAAATVAAILCRGARAQSPLGPSLPKLRPVELRSDGLGDRQGARHACAVLAAPDKSLFARLPEDLLAKVVEDLPSNLAQRTIQTHLSELTAFKIELHSKIEEQLLRMGTADGLAAWLREECKPAFHHEVVVAACLSSFDGRPHPDAYWTSCFDPSDLRTEKCRMILDALVQLSTSEHLLSETDIQIGFSRVLGIVTSEMEVKETRSEFPHLVALLRGAVEKELLAAQFLKLARRLHYGGPLGMQALRCAQRQTPLHSRRVWGTGDLRQMRAEMHDTIEVCLVRARAREGLGR